jgi:hypothetical protein
MKNATGKTCEAVVSYKLTIDDENLLLEGPCSRAAIGSWTGVWLCPWCMKRLNLNLGRIE